MNKIIMLFFVLVVLAGCNEHHLPNVNNSSTPTQQEQLQFENITIEQESNTEYIKEDKPHDIEDTDLFDDMDQYIRTDYTNEYTNEDLEINLESI